MKQYSFLKENFSKRTMLKIIKKHDPTEYKKIKKGHLFSSGVPEEKITDTIKKLGTERRRSNIQRLMRGMRVHSKYANPYKDYKGIDDEAIEVLRKANPRSYFDKAVDWDEGKPIVYADRFKYEYGNGPNSPATGLTYYAEPAPSRSDYIRRKLGVAKHGLIPNSDLYGDFSYVPAQYR